jgi:winged helix DNA-binding protein
MITMKEDIIQHRLASQQISGKKFTRPEDLVSWMGCIQAQDFAGAKWAIGSRLTIEPATKKGEVEKADGAATDAAIERLFNEGKILRTHVLRPTWHFVAPEDIRWMLALTSPRIKAWSAGYRRQLGMEKNVFSKSQSILKKLLKGGKQLPRKELALAFQQAGIRTEEERMVHLLMEAELDGLICSGPLEGKQFTYALLEERVPSGRAFAGEEGKPFAREEALGELALRYFRSRGPATLGDFSWWSGLTIADARIGIRSNCSQYGSFDMEGKTYWYYTGKGGGKIKGETLAENAFTGVVLGAAGITEVERNGGLYVLPAYDEYTVSYTDRDLVIHPKHALRSANGIFKPILLREGRITGTWQRTIKKDSIVVGTDLFKPVGKRLIQSAFAGYGAFMSKKIVW